MAARSIAKIPKDITWDAGIVIQPAFRGNRRPRKTRPMEDVRFVYKGRYYRRPIAPKAKNPKAPELLKLPLTGQPSAPPPLKTPPNTSAQTMADAPSNPSAGDGSTSWSWLDWWKRNAPLIIANFGSLCTLTAFTRSDVLELRSCSVTGSVSFVISSLLNPPPRWGPTLWSSLFACVNSTKIIQILDERRGIVDHSPLEREIYLEHFKPHGVTPKQFEKVFVAGTPRVVKAGDIVTREGELIKSVKLIVRGNTRASTLGRRFTALGSKEGNRDAKLGGNSGAWVGEIAFLRSVDRHKNEALMNEAEKRLEKHSKKSMQSKCVATDGCVEWVFESPVLVSGDRDRNESLSEEAEKRLEKHATKSMQSELPATRGKVGRRIVKTSLYTGDEDVWYCAVSTVVAVEDVELIEWSFDDMESVIKSSRDMQDSLTRAMTAAIVGKVVNLMASQQSALPKLSTWLDHWKYSRISQGELTSESEDDDEDTNDNVTTPWEIDIDKNRQHLLLCVHV